MPGPKSRIDFSRLVEWVDGRLSEEEARAIGEQVATADDTTLADVAWLRKFARATRNAPLETPPWEVRSALVADFEAHAEGRRTPGLLERVVATLTFDGGLRPAVGARAPGTREARGQLIYSTGSFDVVLNWRSRARDKSIDVDGQIFPSGDADLGSVGVQLLQDDGIELAITTTDETGGFAFVAVPPGVYEVVLSTDRVEASLRPVELGS